MAQSLHYTVETRWTDLGQDAPESVRETWKISFGAQRLYIDRGEVLTRIDLETRRVHRLSRATGGVRDSSLFARVENRASGFYSAIHTMQVLIAGQAQIAGELALWTVEAAYGLEWPEEREGPAPELVRAQSTDTQDTDTHNSPTRWCAGELELTRLERSAASQLRPLDRRRLLAHVFELHPRVRADLLELGELPAQLHCDDHFTLRHRIRAYTLIEQSTVELAELDAELDAATPEIIDGGPATLLAREAPAGLDRLARARDLFERGRLLEALLAVFAYTYTTTDKASALVRAIYDRAGWFSPVKKVGGLICEASDERQLRAQLAGLDKLRRKAGDHEHVLDILAGEKQLALQDHDSAQALFASALAHDPGLAAPWVSLGRTYAEQLRYADAWDCYDRADALCPEHVVVGKIHHGSAALRAQFGELFA